MKKLISAVLCAALLIAATTCAFANPASMYVYTANGGALNMRSSMVTGADNLVTKVPYGATVDVISIVNDTWAKCGYNNLEGYCMRRYLVDEMPQKPVRPETDNTLSNSMFNGMTACYYTVTVRPTHPSGFVNLRWAPSLHAKIHGKYYAGGQLVVMAENNTWCQVLDENTNTMGFMVKKFLVAD